MDYLAIGRTVSNFFVLIPLLSLQCFLNSFFISKWNWDDQFLFNEFAALSWGTDYLVHSHYLSRISQPSETCMSNNFLIFIKSCLCQCAYSNSPIMQWTLTDMSSLTSPNNPFWTNTGMGLPVHCFWPNNSLLQCQNSN